MAPSAAPTNAILLASSVNFRPDWEAEDCMPLKKPGSPRIDDSELANLTASARA